MKFKVKPKNRVTAVIGCKQPANIGYEKKTYQADIDKLYGEEKQSFLSSSASMSSFDVYRKLVKKLSGIGWFLFDEDGKPVNELSGSDLIEFFDLQEAAQKNELPEEMEGFEYLDYVFSPLSGECLAVQDENLRKVLEAKN